MIQNLIDQELKKQQTTPRKRSGKFSPSSFGRCYQAQIWNRQNEPVSNPVDARTLRVFKVGKLFHDFVQSFVPESTTEVGGQSDDVIFFADIVGKETVYDIKSQHSRAFWYMEKSGFDIHSEKYTNWLQVMYYARELGKKKGSLIFVSKDDLCIGEYADFVEKWEDDIDCELYHLRMYWDLENAPRFPRAYNGQECKYCNWRETCGYQQDIKREPKSNSKGK